MRLVLAIGTSETREVEVDQFVSVRELLSVCQTAVPPGATVQFHLSGSHLEPDLSIAAQNINDGDTICITFHKPHRRSHSGLLQRIMRGEQMSDALARETYRVADTSFLRYESFHKGEQLYARMLEIIESDVDDAPPSRRTHVEKASRLNEHPLPVCWKDNV